MSKSPTIYTLQNLTPLYRLQRPTNRELLAKYGRARRERYIGCSQRVAGTTTPEFLPTPTGDTTLTVVGRVRLLALFGCRQV